MKKYLMILFVPLCCTILTGCPQSFDSWSDLGTSPGWIGSYFTIKNVAGIRSEIMVADNKFLVNISAGLFYTSARTYINNGDQKYYELCEKYGDLKPGGFLLRHHFCSFGTSEYYMDDRKIGNAIAETINEINITTYHDWDAEHPAGSSLNDIFTIKYYTYYPFIQSGWSLEEPATRVEKPLSELCEGDLKLLSIYGTTLYTSVLPPSGEWCRITVELVLDMGDKERFERSALIE